MQYAKSRPLLVELPYLDVCDGVPLSYTDNAARNNYTLAPRQASVNEARGREDAPCLDRDGFVLLHRPSQVSSFPSDQEIEDRYLPEVKQLLLDYTGAAEVFTFAAGLRFNERSEHTGSRPNSRPSRRVHSDFSDNGVRESVAKAFGKDGNLPERGYWKAFNVWRVLSSPPQDTPLGLCDMRSIKPEDIVTAQGVVTMPDGQENRYEFCLYRYSPAHRWSYFPNMNRDEVIVFMGYDSRNRNLRVPHCAFDDPTCPADAPPRTSVEVRAIAYFPE